MHMQPITQVLTLSQHPTQVIHQTQNVPIPPNPSISNLSTFSDQQFAQQLQQDLNEDNDKNRKLKQISPQSAEELFKIFGL